MRVTIATKLTAGFAVAITVILGLVGFSYRALVDLRELQDQGAMRAQEAAKLTEHAGMGSRLYQVVADAIINRNLDESRADWVSLKKEMEENLAFVQSGVDTEDERQ